MSHRRFPALTLIPAGVLALTTVCIPAATAAGSGAAATTGALQPSTVLAPTIEVPTTRLDISPTSTALSLGQSLTFDAAYDSGPVYPGDVEWASSNDSVLTVDQQGRVSAVGLGEATITVTDKNDASLTSTSTVKVREVSRKQASSCPPPTSPPSSTTASSSTPSSRPRSRAALSRGT